ncbi:MAG: hypothetical protein PVG39_16450 [Desulfobacteraceae bacterium]|jgi:probable HAF family extracellular repeat protein
MEYSIKQFISKGLVSAIVILLLLFGCNSSDDSFSEDTDGPGTSSGELGDLQDIGDLSGGSGETWYYTKIMAISEDGSVVGQSNNGTPARAAFIWDASTEEMTYLGIHEDGAYDDYYNLTEEESDSDEYFIYSEAVGISSSGDAIGNSTTGTNWPDETKKRAFYWKNGEFTDLSPGYYQINFEIDDVEYNYYVMKSFSEAICMNEDYVLVNIRDKTGTHAYYWDKSSRKTIEVVDDEYEGYQEGEDKDEDEPYAVSIEVPDYSILGNSREDDSEAVAINSNNQAIMNMGNTVVFHDLETGTVEYLNGLPGADSTVAVAINESGHIAGTSGSEAFLWVSGVMYPCGDLGGGQSVATGLNNNDQVVGYSYNEDGELRAFLWELVDGEGKMTDLGTLGGDSSWALGINDNGLIIGASGTGDIYNEGSQKADIYHACVWYNDEVYDLGVPTDYYDYSVADAYPFSEGFAVNEDNRIAGNAYTINESSRGFILDPTLP